MHIVGVPLPMSAGQRYDVTCQAVGARPVPSITWWVGETRVDHLETRLQVTYHLLFLFILSSFPQSRQVFLHFYSLVLFKFFSICLDPAIFWGHLLSFFQFTLFNLFFICAKDLLFSCSSTNRFFRFPIFITLFFIFFYL